MDIFSLNNLIKVETSYKSATGTILDIMLTNKMKFFRQLVLLQQTLVTAAK